MAVAASITKRLQLVAANVCEAETADLVDKFRTLPLHSDRNPWCKSNVASVLLTRTADAAALKWAKKVAHLK